MSIKKLILHISDKNSNFTYNCFICIKRLSVMHFKYDQNDIKIFLCSDQCVKNFKQYKESEDKITYQVMIGTLNDSKLEQDHDKFMGEGGLQSCIYYYYALQRLGPCLFNEHTTSRPQLSSCYLVQVD